MAAGIYDILCEQGATFTRELTWKQENGTPVNLTGYTARMQVRRAVSDSTAVVTLTTENGGITMPSPRASGKIVLLLSATATAGLPVIKGVYDLEVVAPNSTVTRLLQGKFAVSAEVTR